MLVVTWNVQCIRGLRPKRLEGIVHALQAVRPDIVLLQEVGVGNAADALRDGLVGIGLRHQFYSGNVRTVTAQEKRKDYGNVIASQWPVTGDETAWAPTAPWPQLLARATVESPYGRLDVYAAHIPNGSGNGWRKIDTFQALATGLGNPSGRPRILAGDFNEPKDVLSSGVIIPFGGIEKRGQEICWDGERYHRKSGDTHPRVRWRDGVLSILGTDAPHGLRHAYLVRHGFRTAVTHVIRGKERFFDHILVSEHFTVVNAGYFTSWRTSGLSDHAGGWAKLQMIQ